MNLQKTTGHGEKLPKGWGLAYIDVNTAKGECFPIPLNLLVRWGREIYFAIAWRRRRNFEKRAWDKGYEEGVKAGRRMESVYHKFSLRTYEDGITEGKRELREAIAEAMNAVRGRT